MKKNLLQGSEFCLKASELLPNINDTAEILDPLPLRLGELEEARGDLLSIICRNGFAVATFPWGVITLPEKLDERLRELVGRKIAVLRLDGYFHIRDLGGEDHASR